MKFKQQIKKAMIAVLLVIAFFIFMNYFQKKEAVVAVDPNKFSIVDSKKELDVQFGKVVPGYELATQYDLVNNYNLEIPIIKENRTLRIEKIWYSFDTLFLFYSLDLKNSDDDPKNLPTLLVEDINLSAKGGKSITLSVNNDLGPNHFYNIENGYVYHNRIYKAKPIVVKDTDRDEFYKLMAEGGEIEKVDLKNLKLKGIKGNETPIEDIALDLNFNLQDGYILDKVEVNRETKMANGDIIHWDEFHIGLYNNFLYYTVKSKDTTARKFNFDLELPRGNNEEDYFQYPARSYPINFDQSGKPYLYMPPFQKVPEYIELAFTSAEYSSNNAIEFTISGDEISTFFKQKSEGEIIEPPEKEIGKTKDFIFSYGGFITDNMSTFYNSGIKIGLKPTNENQNNVFDLYFSTNQEYEDSLKRAKESKDNPFFQYWVNMSGPIIKITDSSGAELGNDGGMYAVSNGTTQYQNFIFQDEKLKAAKELHVKIFKIPELVETVNNEKIRINIK